MFRQVRTAAGIHFSTFKDESSGVDTETVDDPESGDVPLSDMSLSPAFLASMRAAGGGVPSGR